MTRPLADRVAAAPISWGVCEVPDWGWQYDRRTVLQQMQEIGFAATEFGPRGFLPDAPAAKAKVLADNGLRAVGGFVPVRLHDPDHDPVPEVLTELEAYLVAGADTLVLAAATGLAGWPRRVWPGMTSGPSSTTGAGPRCSPTSIGWAWRQHGWG